MTKFRALATQVIICAMLAAPAGAEDPPKKLTAEERNELEAKREELNDAGLEAYRAGKYADAITSFEESLKVARRLYNATEFPDGHANLGVSLNYVADLNLAQGKLAAVEPFVKEALEIYRRLYKGEDDSEIALSLNTLASLYQAQCKLGDAEQLFKDSLEMRKRLFKGQDGPDLALGLNNLAALYKDQGKLVAAEPLYNLADTAIVGHLGRVPLDSLAIAPDTGKAYMHVDECWYCGPCAARCPTGAVTVNMPYLLR